MMNAHPQTDSHIAHTKYCNVLLVVCTDGLTGAFFMGLDVDVLEFCGLTFRTVRLYFWARPTFL